MKNNILISVVTAIGLLIIGCAAEEENNPEVVAITPADGALNVARTTVINVEFNEAMDMSSCETRFGLFPGYLESIPINMTGQMDGLFTWNEDATIMTFHGDKTLMDSIMYSICLQEGMMANSGMGDGMMRSGMNGHGMEVTDGIITTFTTENQPSARIASVNPVDGSIDIDLTTNINIGFDSAMNPESCESRFGLHEGELMEMPMMGMMSGLDGNFQWDSTHTMMTFDPDSMLVDSTMYTICLMEGMMLLNHNDTLLQTGMMDYGNQVDSGILVKFLTK